jgi:hypothetical protein
MGGPAFISGRFEQKETKDTKESKLGFAVERED